MSRFLPDLRFSEIPSTREYTVPMLRRLVPALLGSLLLACGSGSPTTGNDPAPVATVTISGVSGPLTVGQTLQLTLTLKDAGGNSLTGRTVTWNSSAPSIATVVDGLVTAIAAGSATISATAEGKSGSVTITVSAGTPAPVATVTISGGTGPLTPGATLQLAAATFDAGGHQLTGRTVTWSSDATSIATVSASGLVTALAAGSVHISALSEGKSATVTITVNPPAVAQVLITAPTTTFEVGDPAATFAATTKDGQGNVLAGRAVTWSATPTGVVAVSNAGVVTPVAAGNATVTATSEGVSGSVQVTVTASSAASLLEQRILAQQGLAIALASTVLQTQLYTLIAVNGADPDNCLALPGGGAMRIPPDATTLPSVITFFFDTACTRTYMAETVSMMVATPGNNYHMVASAAYSGPTGTPLGTIAFNEYANSVNFANGVLTGTVNGLGNYSSADHLTNATLGLNCNFGAAGHNVAVCQGGIVQSFLALNADLGSVATLGLDSLNTGQLNFAGTSALSSGAIGSLVLSQPAPTTMVINGGSAYGAATAGGGAASFSLFPPTPTGWSVTDAAHDMVFTIALVDNATRTLTATLKRISSGATLATVALDQSGTGTITYSNGQVAAVTSWMLSQ